MVMVPPQNNHIIIWCATAHLVSATTNGLDKLSRPRHGLRHGLSPPATPGGLSRAPGTASPRRAVLGAEDFWTSAVRRGTKGMKSSELCGVRWIPLF